MAITQKKARFTAGVYGLLAKHCPCDWDRSTDRCHYLPCCTLCGPSAWKELVCSILLLRRRYHIHLTCTCKYRVTSYTVIWNALDCPAAVLPVTNVDPAIDVKKPPHNFISETDEQVYELCMSFVRLPFNWACLIDYNFTLRWPSHFQRHPHSNTAGRTNLGRWSSHTHGRNCRCNAQEAVSTRPDPKVVILGDYPCLHPQNV